MLDIYIRIVYIIYYRDEYLDPFLVQHYDINFITEDSLIYYTKSSTSTEDLFNIRQYTLVRKY